VVPLCEILQISHRFVYLAENMRVSRFLAVLLLLILYVLMLLCGLVIDYSRLSAFYTFPVHSFSPTLESRLWFSLR